MATDEIVLQVLDKGGLFVGGALLIVVGVVGILILARQIGKDLANLDKDFD